jgi:hypothetical protein
MKMGSIDWASLWSLPMNSTHGYSRYGYNGYSGYCTQVQLTNGYRVQGYTEVAP